MQESRTQADFMFSFCIEQIGHVTCFKDWYGERHAHTFWELIYIAKNDGYIQYEDRQDPALNGKLYLIQPYEQHTFMVDGTEQAAISYIGFRYNRDNHKWRSDHPYHDVCSYLPQAPQLAQLMQKIAQMTNKKDLEQLAFQASSALLPLVEWLDEHDAVHQTPPSSSALLCRKVIGYLQENFDRNVSVKEIAGSLYVSPHHLGNVFQRQMKQTIKQYQMRIKMEEAISLLRETDLTISEIAFRLGWGTQQYFSKSFKDYYGFTPIEARKFGGSKIKRGSIE